MAPRPGTPVIHPQMLGSLAPVAESAQTGRGQLLEPGSGAGTVDEDTLKYTAAAATVVWAGSCRFQTRSRTSPREVDSGEEPVTLIENQLTIPLSAPEPRVGQLFRMVTSSDSALAGKVFRIVNVAMAELQIERHLTVEDNETNPRPS